MGFHSVAELQPQTEPYSTETGQRLLAAMMDEAADALVAVTSSGIILTWSRGAEVLFGYPAAEVVGKTLPILDSPSWSVGGDAGIPAECAALRKDGRQIRISIRGYAVRDSAGTVAAIFLNLKSLSEGFQSTGVEWESLEFRGIFEQAPFAMCVTSLDGKFIQVNSAFCRLLGYSEQELLAKRFAELTHPDDMKRSLEMKDQLGKVPDEFQEAEKRYIHRSGAVVWTRIKISVARDVFRKPAYFVVHIEDISEKKRTLEVLRENEDRIRIQAKALQSAGDCISITDTEDRILYVNPALLRTYGYQEDELVGRNIAMLRSERTPKELQAEILPASLAGEWRGELWNRTKGGREFPISLFTSAVCDNDGRRLALVGVARDITKRRQAEQRRQFQLSLIRSIHKVSLDGILVVNNEGIVVSHNERFLDVWQISRPVGANKLPGDAIGTPDGPLLESIVGQLRDPEPFLKRVLELYQDVNQTDHCEVELKDGRTLERYSTSLINDEGQCMGRVWFFRDISERKQQEAQLVHAWERADARSGILEKINRRDPLGEILGATGSFLKLHFPDSECCIHLCSGGEYLELAPESCSSPELGERLKRVRITAREEICARAAADGNWLVELQGQPAYCWPVLDSDRRILGTVSVFPPWPLPDLFPRVLDATVQLVALAINNRGLFDGLTRLSNHDSLTGLPNRAFLDGYLASCLESAGNSTVRFAIAYVDLDAFKEINDIYGHMTGDRFLQIAASRFGAVLREGDLLARIGGDEFIAVLQDVRDRNDAARRGRRLLEALQEPFAIRDSLRIPCTASIGIALFPDDGSTVEDLTRSADESMYVAKTAGKNRVQVCDQLVLEKNQLSPSRLRQAMEDSRLRVHYQPVFLADGALGGFEALVRIQDPLGHLIPPARFIDIAERSALVVPLGREVLRQACLQAAAWERRCHGGLKMSVNVSARQFAQPGFSIDVLSALSEAGLMENLLELEITEGAQLKDLSGALRQIENLRGHGVRIALDDFGTGYSTLSLVNAIPIDTLKIDRSFIQDLNWNNSRVYPIKSILSLAAGFCLETVAEGVEEADQLEILRALGCDAFQGFGFAHPMSAASVEARLEGWLAAVPDLRDRLETADPPARRGLAEATLSCAG